MANHRDEAIRDMSLDSEKLLPNKQQREWLAAQAYVLQKDGSADEIKETAEYFGRKYKEPELAKMGAEIAYNSVNSRLTRNLKDFSGEDLFDNYLHEKSLKLDKFDNDPADIESPIDNPN